MRGVTYLSHVVKLLGADFSVLAHMTWKLF